MDEALIKRVLPHSVEAEQSVIGSMLMDREAIIAQDDIKRAENQLLTVNLLTPGFPLLFFLIGSQLILRAS